MGRPAITISEPTALPEHELIARVFRTLGDATRVGLVERLLQVEEATQRELIEAVGASQSRVSEHLSCLVWCGFVSTTREGRTVTYRLTDDHAHRFIDLARDFLANNTKAVGCCTVLDEESR